MKEKDLFRMVLWLALAAMFYVTALYVSNPQLQTGLWKAGHITSGAYLGYWIDRQLYGRFAGDHAYTPRVVARALVVGAAIIGMAFGL